MSFTNGQNVQAADLNNLEVTTLETTGDATVGDDLDVTGDGSVGGNLVVTGSLMVGGQPISAAVARSLCCGRLSLTSGTPVTTADVSAATTLYWALYDGNQIALYSGTEWVLFALSELTIAVPASTNQMYDVFVNYNSGVPALALTAWTNDTTRATALTKQDGVLVKTGSTTHRFVGCIRTTGVSGQTEDSVLKRFVSNYYHAKPRTLRANDGTNSWNYTLATWRQANGAAANKVEFIIPVAEMPINLRVHSLAINSGGANPVHSAVGLDSITAPHANNVGIGIYTSGTQYLPVIATLKVYPAVGYHYGAWLEYSNAAGTTTWLGDNGDATLWQTGIEGEVLG